MTSIQETRRPTLLSFNGCPQPDAVKMELKDKRQPDKPFLDIAGGWSAGSLSGGCFACPTVDENGDFLLTSRNANSLLDRNNNTGCDINFRWKAPAFPEPGLSGLEGAKEILLELSTLQRPSDVTVSLRMAGDARGLKAADVDTFVVEEWNKIALTPSKSELRTMVYSYLRTAMEKNGGHENPCRKQAAGLVCKLHPDPADFHRPPGTEHVRCMEIVERPKPQRWQSESSLGPVLLRNRAPGFPQGSVGSDGTRSAWHWRRRLRPGQFGVLGHCRMGRTVRQTTRRSPDGQIDELHTPGAKRRPPRRAADDS